MYPVVHFEMPYENYERVMKFYNSVFGWQMQKAVDDIEKIMKKIVEEKGKVLGEPMEILGIGLYVSFNDTEGNRVSTLQPNQR